jgi:Ca2+/Na+ antiporter
MKKLYGFCFLYLFPMLVFAQKSNSDSLAYQLQRAKINQMLDQRRQKFGQYDQSLKMHTGIFGLQTKKDIRRSNDILMDIVKTDDDIFRELKILMDYRVFQQQQAQTHSSESENVTLAYMNTINRLRGQIDQLKREAEKEKTYQQNLLRILIGVVVLLFVSILYILSRKRGVKA